MSFVFDVDGAHGHNGQHGCHGYHGSPPGGHGNRGDDAGPSTAGLPAGSALIYLASTDFLNVRVRCEAAGGTRRTGEIELATTEQMIGAGELQEIVTHAVGGDGGNGGVGGRGGDGAQVRGIALDKNRDTQRCDPVWLHCRVTLRATTDETQRGTAQARTVVLVATVVTVVVAATVAMAAQAATFASRALLATSTC
jgi:hypothetical protein